MMIMMIKTIMTTTKKIATATTTTGENSDGGRSYFCHLSLNIGDNDTSIDHVQHETTGIDT